MSKGVIVQYRGYLCSRCFRPVPKAIALCQVCSEESHGSENVVAGGTITKLVASTVAQSRPRDIRESVERESVSTGPQPDLSATP